jgi:hypothetical protein
MPNDTSGLQAIVQRLEGLERQNRRLKLAAIATVTVASAFLLMGQARPARTIEAERFVVKDSSGAVRAQLAAEGTDVRLVLYDTKGESRASLYVVPDGPGLMLTGSGQKPYVRLSMSEKRAESGLEIADANAVKRAALLFYPYDGGEPGLVLQDANGTPRVGMYWQANVNNNFVALDANKKTIWHAP